MQMPEKFIKFLDLINGQLFYIKDDIVILEEADLLQAGFSVADIKLALHLLQEKEIVHRYKIWDDLKFSSIRTDIKDKLFMLDNDGWAGRVPADNLKAQYVIQLCTREKFLELYKEASSSNQKTEKEPAYDSMNGVLSLSDSVYKATSKLRRDMLNFLWRKRRVLKGDQEITKGELFPKEAMAVQVGLIQENKDFLNVKERIDQEVSQLNKIFRDKEFPLKITMRGGIQLIETT